MWVLGGVFVLKNGLSILIRAPEVPFWYPKNSQKHPKRPILQCASSQFLFWMLQPCFVLMSRLQKNFSSFPLSSGLFSIIVSRFGLLAVGLCSSGQQQSLHFHDFYPKWDIKCHPKCIASNNSKPKWIQKCKYFTDYVCKCNPNLPAWKMQSRNTFNTNSFCRSHKYW